MKSIAFISNSDPLKPNHADFINEAIKDAEEIILCAAYWKLNGIDLIKTQLISALENDKVVRLYASLNEWNTRPDALIELYKIASKYPNASLSLCCKLKTIFHSKIYYFRNIDSFSAIVGSANLTSGGLSGNDEVSVMITSSEEIPFHGELIHYLNNLDKQKMVQPATMELINKYTVEFNKKHNLRKKYGLISDYGIVL